MGYESHCENRLVNVATSSINKHLFSGGSVYNPAIYKQYKLDASMNYADQYWLELNKSNLIVRLRQTCMAAILPGDLEGNKKKV